MGSRIQHEMTRRFGQAIVSLFGERDIRGSSVNDWAENLVRVELNAASHDPAYEWQEHWQAVPALAKSVAQIILVAEDMSMSVEEVEELAINSVPHFVHVDRDAWTEGVLSAWETEGAQND